MTAQAGRSADAGGTGANSGAGYCAPRCGRARSAASDAVSNQNVLPGRAGRLRAGRCIDSPLRPDHADCGGTEEPDWRGVERAKVVPRSRFNPAFLNALSSSTVEPRSSRRTGTDSWSACIGMESGPADEPAIWGCEALEAISARKAPQPRTAATRARTATMANADCPRGHREGIPTPKLTVPCTLPAEFGHQPTRDVLQNRDRNGGCGIVDHLEAGLGPLRLRR